jgi:CubicO group peptidase (beta-lactamase class C family)
MTYGWLTGEILRRATGLMPGELIAKYLTEPLDAEAWIGLPAELEPRVARMHPTTSKVMTAVWRAWPVVLPRVGRDTMVRVATMGQVFPFRMVDGSPNDYNSRVVHAAQIPASNVILNARSLAKIYASAVAPMGGPPLLTRSSMRDAVKPRSEGLHWSKTLTPPGARFSTGFLINGIPYRPLISDSSFGHDGASGSLGFADADHQIGFGYLNNRMSSLRDTRANRLTAALRDCLAK